MPHGQTCVYMDRVWKSYQSRPVLRNVSLTLKDGEALWLTAPSGAGKTTLFRLVLGLEMPERGTVRISGSCSAVFQEDRLLEEFSPMDNLRFVLGRRDRKELETLLRPLLPENCFEQPSVRLSGGMKRRLALIRALAAPSRILVLDEPFTGLDEDTRRTAETYLAAHRRGRTLLLASHQPPLEELKIRICTLQKLEQGGV